MEIAVYTHEAVPFGRGRRHLRSEDKYFTYC